MNRGARALLATVALAAGAGCLPSLGLSPRVGQSLWRSGSIEPGLTTKAALLDRFGPPMAIAARGEEVEVPWTPLVLHQSLRWTRVIFDEGMYGWVQQADAWFEPFSTRRELRPSNRVYYWYAIVERGVTWIPVWLFDVRVDGLKELWVLVDEETGLVDDVVTRKR